MTTPRQPITVEEAREMALKVMTDTEARIQTEREAESKRLQAIHDRLYAGAHDTVPDPTMGRRMEEAPPEGPALVLTDRGGIEMMHRSKLMGTWHLAGGAHWPTDSLRCWWPLSALQVPDWAKGGA